MLDTTSQVFDTKELAKLLDVSPRTVQAWRLKGVGPRFYTISKRCVRYRREDVEAWLTACRQEVKEVVRAVKEDVAVLS